MSPFHPHPPLSQRERELKDSFKLQVNTSTLTLPLKGEGMRGSFEFRGPEGPQLHWLYVPRYSQRVTRNVSYRYSRGSVILPSIAEAATVAGEPR